VVFEAGRSKRLGRGDGGLQRGGFVAADLGDVDLGPKWLAQCRLHRQAAQCQCLRIVQRQGQ
jgi:hypothetical protein